MFENCRFDMEQCGQKLVIINNMKEIEIEKTYLAKYIPEELLKFESKELLDLYVPATSHHPILRIRKKGDKFEITKKSPVQEGDASHQNENTIPLTKEEFEAFSKLDAKRISKTRYFAKFDGRDVEIDVFKDDLEGLVVVDFEFNSIQEKDSFLMPDFCLADVTQDEFIAGGMLCGKKYTDLQSHLEKYKYGKIIISD